MLDTNERSTTTNTSGAFSFTGLAPGTYQLRVVKQTGWDTALPSGSHRLRGELITLRAPCQATL